MKYRGGGYLSHFSDSYSSFNLDQSKILLSGNGLIKSKLNCKFDYMALNAIISTVTSAPIFAFLNSI